MDLEFASEFLAVARASKKTDKKAREAMTVGTKKVDALFHVTGEMEVLPDEQYIPTAELPVKLLLAVFLKRSGAIGKANADLLRSIVREAMEARDNAPELDEIVEEYMQPICDAMPTKTRAGKLLAKKLKLELVRQ